LLGRRFAGKIRPMPRSPSRSAAAPATAFDAAYFRRFYFDRSTRVTTATETRARARMVAALLDRCELPVCSVLDAGCGVGALRAPFTRHWPRVSYTGLESSHYLCARYGWRKGSIADFAPGRRYDLIVCYDVLQYLDDRAAARALANLDRLAHTAIYLSALTSEDWRDNCDQRLTDRAVHLRGADWYRRRLARRFRFLGCGVWIRKSVRPILWELERPAAPLSRARESSRRAPGARARPPRSRRADR